tara:strand:+ start:357 stop:821 length:465 start_codon:yes stop_codon:yes gene_type:complete
MNAFKTILKKLYSGDNPVFAVLKAENKLELAAIDDLDSALSEAEQISDIAVLGDVLQKTDELIELNSELENVKENFYTEFQSLEFEFSDLKDKIDLLEARLNAYEELSDELGIDPRNSDLYTYGDNLLLEMQDQYREYNSNLDRINRAFEIVQK